MPGGCRIGCLFIGREMIPTRRDDPYLGDFKQTIRKTFCPDDCYPVVQSMFPWEVSTASQQEIDHLVA